MTRLTLCIGFFLASCAMAQPSARPARLKATNAHLVVTCVAGKPAGKTRTWNLSEPTTFTFTMRNQPRPGVANEDPGMATIAFTPEAGHEYDIEVRGDAAAFSTRVWKAGAWKPVVRDRTSDRIVSSDPTWGAKGCE